MFIFVPRKNVIVPIICQITITFQNQCTFWIFGTPREMLIWSGSGLLKQTPTSNIQNDFLTHADC